MGSSLFASYLAERTGEGNLSILVAQATDGIEGVDAYLDLVQPGLDFEGMFANWLVANIVDADEGPREAPPVPFAVWVCAARTSLCDDALFAKCLEVIVRQVEIVQKQFACVFADERPFRCRPFATA